MFTALAIVAWLIGAMGLLMLLTLLLAGGANSTKERLRRIKRLLLTTALMGMGILVGSAWLMVEGRPLWAAGLGVVPAAIVLGLMIWAEWTR